MAIRFNFIRQVALQYGQIHRGTDFFDKKRSHLVIRFNIIRQVASQHDQIHRGIEFLTRNGAI
jgi:hypothetical protein